MFYSLNTYILVIYTIFHRQSMIPIFMPLKQYPETSLKTLQYYRRELRMPGVWDSFPYKFQFKLPWLVIVATFALPMVISPLYNSIRIAISKPRKASLTDADASNVRELSDLIQQKTTRHELMTRLYIRLNKYYEQLNEQGALRTGDVVSNNIEIMRLHYDILDYFAREGSKFSDVDIKDINITSP